jgi:hypothetical protein
MLFMCGAVLVVFTLLLSLVTPPTTWDCIGYHLPRQIYWIQNHSVSFYPSGDLRQLQMPPLAEYLGAQLMLLSGNDHQANLIQWLAYLLCALAASVIARDLGAGRLGQVFAAALVLLNPAAATQSENPKNDIIEALWILILMWSAVGLWKGRRCRIRDAVFIGVTLGLAILTKGTGYALAFPICIFIAVATQRAGWRRALPLGAAMILIAAAINTPHWIRNAQAFGSPLGLSPDRGGFSLTNTTFSPPAITSNLIRNLSIHTSTPSQSVNSSELAAIEKLHDWMGIDASDPRTTIRRAKFAVQPQWMSDGANGAPIHLLLAVLIAGSLCTRRWKPGHAWPALVLPAAAALCFAVAFKWQPWHARLHIPIVAAAAPAMGLWGERRRIVMAIAIPLASFVACAGVLFNEAKPVLGPNSVLKESREQILFQTQPSLLPDAIKAVELAARLSPTSIALEIERATCEYSVQRLALDRLLPAKLSVLRRLVGPPAPPSPAPDVALTYYPSPPSLPCRITHEPSGATMRWVSGSGPFRIYVPNDKVDQVHQLLPIPDFFGWDSEEGLLAPEGPYPQWNLPIVRWADKPHLSLGFETGAEPMLLILECRRNQRQDQVMEVKLNGRSLLRHEFGASDDFVSLRVPLEVRPGPNSVTIDFANVNQSEQARAALFRKIQIIPARWSDTQERASPPTP